VRVGVLGAGLSGTLVALQLADAGHDVALLDRKPDAIEGASGASEGKIHLGYVYAADRSRRTATAMAQAAATFRPLIERWIGSDAFNQALSAPFTYAVHRNSLVAPDDIRCHFGAVSEAVRAACGPTAPPECSAHWRELTDHECCHLFDPRQVVCAFLTEERAIRPDAISLRLRSCLLMQQRITCMFGHHVDSVGHDGNRLMVTGSSVGGMFRERFDVVVNALWEHRLRIDSIMRTAPTRPVVHRFKYGLWSDSSRVARSMPSVTFLLGEYGDCVSFDGQAYASWYPAGLASQEVALCPSRQDFELTAAARQRLIADTLDPLAQLMPAIAGMLVNDRDSWSPRGGFITAWGRTGIDDARSELHERHEVGVHSDCDWHSIDTGKLTMAPMFAATACARILATHGTSR
jgi:hypothetical protein